MSLPQAPPTILGMCGVCGNDATIICTECSNMEYCNPTCQAANLTFHKTICPQLQGFPSSHAPSNLHFRSILFPINSKVPRFLWLPHFLDEYYKLDLRMIENHLTGKSENFEIECPHCEDIIDVFVWWKDRTIPDLAPSPALLDVSGAPADDVWRGAVLVRKYREDEHDTPLHLDARCFPAIVTWIINSMAQEMR
jgi:hypothetical protein